MWDNVAYAGHAPATFVSLHAIGDDRAVVLSTAGAALVHLKDGSVPWRSAFALAPSSLSSQVASDGATLFVLADTELLALDVKTGSVTTSTVAAGSVLRKTDASGAVVAVTVSPASITVASVERSDASETTARTALGLASDFAAVDSEITSSLVVTLASGERAYVKIADSLALEAVANVAADGVLVESLTEDSTLFHVAPKASGSHVSSFSLLPDQSRVQWSSAFDAPAFGGDVQRAFVGCPVRQKDSDAPRCRALLVMKDDGLVFSTNEEPSESASNVLWTREEALANIASVQWVTPAETDIEKAPLTKIPSFREELALEVQRAKAFAQSILSFSSALLENKRERSEGRRKESPNAHFFGFSKYVVALTESGKLFAIRAELATVAWSVYVGPEYKLYVTRDHPALGAGPELLLVSRSSHLLWIDGDSGKVIESVQAPADDASWVVMLPKRAHHVDEDASVRRSVALVSASTLAVSLYPQETADFAHPELNHFYFYRYDASANALRGFVVENDAADGAAPAYRAQEVWSVVLPRGHELASFSSQKEHTVIDSSVTITGDDSLLLKYLNPNLFGVATLGRERVDGEAADVSVLHVSLLDSVAGRVIHRGRHHHATGPVRMVQVRPAACLLSVGRGT